MENGYAYLRSFMVLIACAFLISSCKRSQPYPSLKDQRSALLNKNPIRAERVLDSITLVNDLAFLSSDSCEGRKPGSAGHSRAVERILLRLRESAIDSFGSSLIQEFSNGRIVNGTRRGQNIIGYVKGTLQPERFIVISAHFDHLGREGDAVYYGASDNASGTACLLEMARYFKKNPLPCSVVFAFFDREETRLEGSWHFIKHLPAPLSIASIRVNLNLDMITRNEENELFACGIYHYPQFKSLIQEIQSTTSAHLLMGHDVGGGHDDWTSQSDHFVFHEHKIPFIYFGVEDHSDYHKPSDTFEKIDLSQYLENCNMLTSFAKLL